MEYLTVDDLKKDNVINYKGVKLLLHEPAGERMTYIDDANDDKDDGIKIDISAKVFMRQRWKVTILPPDNDRFAKEFTTHRYVCAYYCTYGELLEEQDRIYTAWEVTPHKPIDSNNLGDDFGNYF